MCSMRRSSALFFLPFAVVPVIAFALTIEPGSLYKDVRQSSPEAAGINMLSREGVVQGYGNGLFGPSRQINRAEFLKMAIVALGHHPEISMRPELDAPKTGAATDPYCFPDVRIGDWFSPPVCYAFTKEVVRGNPDGLFHPERTVNYAEALKMLTLLFGYEIPSIESADWPEQYYRSASLKQVDLPITIRFDTPLTRGLAARLIAAFLAESTGQLAAFRLAEAGEYLPPSSSSSSVSSSSSSSISSLASSASSSISSESSFTLPPVSHFLVLGRPSDAVASITLRSPGDIALIMSVQVKLFNEVTALHTLELVNVTTGESVALLNRRTTTDTSDYKLTYEVQIPLELQKEIPADIDAPFALRANIRSVDNNGSSEQLLHVRTFSVTIRGKSSTESTNVPATGPFPKHQTSFGKIVKVQRVTPSTGTLVSGTAAVVSTFSVTSEMLPGKTFGVEHALLSLSRTGQVSAKNWRVNQVGSALSAPCSQSQDLLQISCENLGSIGLQQSAAPLQLEFRADVFVPLGSTGNSLQADLQSVGSPETIGSIQWTDGSGHFKWIEGKDPVARGTRWQ